MRKNIPAFIIDDSVLKDIFEGKNKEYKNLKGVKGFVITWVILVIYSAIMIIFNWKLSLFGFIICWVLGFLGFDMIGSLCKKDGGRK